MRTEESSRRMPRGKFQQLSLEMAAISMANFMNLDSKRAAQATEKKAW